MCLDNLSAAVLKLNVIEGITIFKYPSIDTWTKFLLCKETTNTCLYNAKMENIIIMLCTYRGHNLQSDPAFKRNGAGMI